MRGAWRETHAQIDSKMLPRVLHTDTSSCIHALFWQERTGRPTRARPEIGTGNSARGCPTTGELWIWTYKV